MTEAHQSDDATVDDGVLARAVAGGSDQRAEAMLVRRFSRRVFLYGMRHLGDAARADDLAQDVMTTVLERLRAGEVHEPDRIGSFILGTARWTVRDVRRRERRASEVAEAAAREREEIVAVHPPVDAERLAEALAGLSERERAVIVLSFLEDRSAQEIADTFGLRPGHVRVIRHRALGRLAALMGVDELESEAAR